MVSTFTMLALTGSLRIVTGSRRPSALAMNATVTERMRVEWTEQIFMNRG
jgi:hypothetical protein